MSLDAQTDLSEPEQTIVEDSHENLPPRSGNASQNIVSVSDGTSSAAAPHIMDMDHEAAAQSHYIHDQLDSEAAQSQYSMLQGQQRLDEVLQPSVDSSVLHWDWLLWGNSNIFLDPDSTRMM